MEGIWVYLGVYIVGFCIFKAPFTLYRIAIGALHLALSHIE